MNWLELAIGYALGRLLLPLALVVALVLVAGITVAGASVEIWWKGRKR